MAVVWGVIGGTVIGFLLLVLLYRLTDRDD